MKKIIIAIAALSAALSFTSCNKEEVVTGGSDIQPEAPVTVYATTGGMTKTSLSGNDTDGYQVLWSADDEIIFVSQSDPAKKAFFTLKDGVGKTSGTFVLKDGQTAPEGGPYTVYYPATYDGTNWPASQTYAEGNIAGSPMKAQVTVADGKTPASVEFMNEGGILRLTVKGTATVKSIEVRATELSTSITLSCGPGVALTSEGTVFHIAMPSGSESTTYTGVKIILTDTKGKKCTKAFKGTTGLVIERSMITKASFTASDFKAPVTYNAGDKVTIDDYEGIVVEIDGDKVIVATMNVGATSVNEDKCIGSYMTYDDACDSIWSGWRLPTVDELTAFCDPFYPGVCGNTDEGTHYYRGVMMWNIDGVDGIDLYLPLNDYDEYDNPSDKYWTGTTDDCGDTYYYFAPAIDWENDYSPLEPDYIRKEPAAKDSEFLVRLFHDLP